MRRALWCALLYVGCVSGLDVWFCMRDAEFLIDVELNPLAKSLMEWGGVRIFVAIKHVSLATVVVILYELDRRRYRHTAAVLWAVVAVQTVVLCCYVYRVMP